MTIEHQKGSYKIVRKKCDNRLYKSLMISYPSESDKVRAAKKGVNTGGYITIHGQPKWNADGRGDNYTLSRDCAVIQLSKWRAVSKIDIHG